MTRHATTAAPRPRVSLERAEQLIAQCLRADSGGRVGLEAEFLVVDPDDPTRAVTAQQSAAAAGADDLPFGSRITIEPGGQLELSAPPAASAATALERLDGDERELRRRCAEAGLHLAAIGLDPLRPPVRTVDKPRYRVMEGVFGAVGPRPMTMATASAATQVNIDAGPDPVRTWRVANCIGPTLLAMFANSPVAEGRPTGWKSTRQLYWSTVPDGRGAPVPAWHLDAWVDHVLDTPVLCVMRDGDAVVPDPALTMRQWIREPVLDGPTDEDLAYHLTTIFPPVRPRGFLELRMIDAVPAPVRRVAVAVAVAVLAHADAGQDAVAACLPVAGSWSDAARHGLAHAGLRSAAVRLLEIAEAGIGDADLSTRCGEWRHRMAEPARCPADDLLDLGVEPVNWPVLGGEWPELVGPRTTRVSKG